MKRIFLRFILFMLTLNQAAVAQDLKALGAPDNPKVNISWNRFYSTEEIGKNLQKLAKAYRLVLVGKLPQCSCYQRIGGPGGFLPGANH